MHIRYNYRIENCVWLYVRGSLAGARTGVLLSLQPSAVYGIGNSLLSIFSLMPKKISLTGTGIDCIYRHSTYIICLL